MRSDICHIEKKKLEKNRLSTRSNESAGAIATLLRSVPSIMDIPQTPTPGAYPRRYTDSIISSNSSQANSLWDFKDSDTLSIGTISLRSDGEYNHNEIIANNLCVRIDL